MKSESKINHQNRIRPAFFLWGLIVSGLLGGCVETEPFSLEIVTPQEIFLHRVAVKGMTGSRFIGYRCTTRPLFFSQDKNNLEHRGVLEVIKQLEKPIPMAVEKVSGTISTEFYGLWTERCIRFTAMPIYKASEMPLSSRNKKQE